MICQNCGVKISASATICPSCGVRLVRRAKRPDPYAASYAPDEPEYDDPNPEYDDGYDADPQAEYDPDQAYDDPDQEYDDPDYDPENEYDEYDEYEEEPVGNLPPPKKTIPKKVWMLAGLLAFAILTGVILGLVFSSGDGGKMPTVSTVDPLTTSTVSPAETTTVLSGIAGTTTSLVSTTSASVTTSVSVTTAVTTTQMIQQTNAPVVTTTPPQTDAPTPVVTTSPITKLDNTALVGTWKGTSGMYDLSITLNSNATGNYSASSNGIPFPSVPITYTYQSGSKQLCLTNPDDSATGGASTVMSCYVVVEGNTMYCYQSESALAQHPSSAASILTKQ